MKSVRPLAVPPVAYIENATADAVVDVVYPAMTYRKGYTEFKADNLTTSGPCGVYIATWVGHSDAALKCGYSAAIPGIILDTEKIARGGENHGG